MSNPEKGVLKPWCVLIMDDSLEHCAKIRSMLLNGSERHLSFIEVVTAETGIKAVLGAPLHPDCIVLDYNLPEPAAHLVTTTNARHRILVVDDNVDDAETMAMLLELSGHDTRTAFCGQEALDMALSFFPAVVFLDIGLPGMNGYEVARRLLADSATAESKLIALTGWGAEDDISNSKIAGFHAHLTKPVDPDTIDATIAKVLSARQAK